MKYSLVYEEVSEIVNSEGRTLAKSYVASLINNKSYLQKH